MFSTKSVGHCLSFQAKLIANPFAYQEHRERVIRDKVEKARESRIRTSKAQNLPKINKNLATRLLKGEEKRKKKLAEAGEAAPDSEDAGPDATGVFADSRFGDLFTNPEFEIDEESREYELRNAGSAVVSQSDSHRVRTDSDSRTSNVVLMLKKRMKIPHRMKRIAWNLTRRQTLHRMSMIMTSRYVL